MSHGLVRVTSSPLQPINLEPVNLKFAGMLIIALDYDYVPSAELTCTKDARTMYRPLQGILGSTVWDFRGCSKFRFSLLCVQIRSPLHAPSINCGHDPLKGAPTFLAMYLGHLKERGSAKQSPYVCVLEC